MKRSIILLIAVVLVAVGIAIAIIYNNINPQDSTQPMYPINHPMVGEGYSITVTEVVSTDSYTAPDGKEHTAVTGGKLLVVKCKVVCDLEWSVKKETAVYRTGSSAHSLYDSIREAEDNGESVQILLFSLPSGTYTGEVENYCMELSFCWGDQSMTGHFPFWEIS